MPPKATPPGVAQSIALPPAGRKGRIPTSPYPLSEAGHTWWKWAWRTPQSTRWNKGDHYVAARRARLEDDLAVLRFGEDDHLQLEDLLAGAEPEAVRSVEWALDRLKSAASGRLAIEKEMRELENRLGLNPRAMADLRWVIVTNAPEVSRLDDLSAARARRRKGSAGA